MMTDSVFDQYEYVAQAVEETLDWIEDHRDELTDDEYLQWSNVMQDVMNDLNSLYLAWNSL